MTAASDNIVLIGFASTGKTAVGRVLAEKLEFSFIDLDDLVEALHLEKQGVKRRCREIYSLLGRECFIGYETRALDSLVGTRRAVIALGGGTPVSEVNRERAARLGTVVYLHASPEAIFERMRIKGFPQYLGDNPSIEILAALTAERGPIYEKIADIVIDNTRLSPEEAASAAAQALAKAAAAPEETGALKKENPS
jgi:shikimate kinase